jgi:hypothetical protein
VNTCSSGRSSGLLIRPRYGEDGATVTGYAFADQAARSSSKSPIWFGGGKLAPDLTVTGLRHRWGQTPANEITRVADLTAAAAVSAEPGTQDSSRRPPVTWPQRSRNPSPQWRTRSSP